MERNEIYEFGKACAYQEVVEIKDEKMLVAYEYLKDKYSKK